MRNIRGRKAFTLIELIIVIVILGILAAIAIVGYNAVVNRSKEQAVRRAAEAYDREVRALAAFELGETTDPAFHQEMVTAGDIPNGVEEVKYWTLGADGAFGGDDANADTEVLDLSLATDVEGVTFEQGDKIAQLVLDGSYTTPGTITVTDAS